jgi:adenylate cyclase, class 2
MNRLNIEIKAKISDPEKIRTLLKNLNADFKGTDRQTDTYFNVPEGRFKLREGNIENNLIFYKRTNQKGPKPSDFMLYKPDSPKELKSMLSEALGILKIVEKEREIWFIDNVKFHIDQVKGLGRFFEIEATDLNGKIGYEKLKQQCDYYLTLFEIKDSDLIEHSYSDMID